MDRDSTNLQAPRLGPTAPLYPELPQLCEVSGPVTVNNIYPGFVQQFSPALVLRRREACWVHEPNGLQLYPIPGLSRPVYDCRLVSSYHGLPLYVATCCPTQGFSSASSSSSAAPVARASLGKTQGGYPVPVSTLTLSSLTIPSNSLLVAVASVVGSAGLVGSVRWGPYTLGVDAEAILPGAASLAGSLAILSATIDSGGTNDLVLTSTLPGALTLQAMRVSGLYDDVPDQSASATGVASAPDSGSTGNTTAVPEYVQGAFLMLTPPSWSWLNGFLSGGQDLSQTVQGVSVSVTEGWKQLAALQAVDAALGGGNAAAWAGACVTYF